MKGASPGTQQSFAVQRVIGRLAGASSGPTVLVIAGLHGNEPAGVVAAQRVFGALAQRAAALRGDAVALAGNLAALQAGVRYLDSDLNRHWTADILAAHRSSRRPSAHEDAELADLHRHILHTLQRARGPVHAIDLHTTSNAGAPFATIGDTLANRDFASHFHTSVVLGLEEELQGTLLEFLSDHGCITMGFEAGQHRDPLAVQLHEAVIWTALVTSGVLRAEDVPDLAGHQATLAGRCRHCPAFFEILYRHVIQQQDGFRMLPGFSNFDRVRRRQVLGEDRRGAVRSPRGGMILMPLYQGLGSDGFFVGRRVRPFWLRLSAWLRHLRCGRFMHWLPGVSRLPGETDVLRVDTRIARLYPLQVFHLLGFRRRRLQGQTLFVSRRREFEWPVPMPLSPCSPERPEA
jgi:succinylglutamate desuccinylase